MNAESAERLNNLRTAHIFAEICMPAWANSMRARKSSSRSLLKHISLFARYVSIMQKGKHYCGNNELVECWLSTDTT